MNKTVNMCVCVCSKVQCLYFQKYLFRSLITLAVIGVNLLQLFISSGDKANQRHGLYNAQP